MNSRVFGGILTPSRRLVFALRALVVHQETFSTSSPMSLLVDLKIAVCLVGSSSLRAATKPSSIAQFREKVFKWAGSVCFHLK